MKKLTLSTTQYVYPRFQALLCPPSFPTPVLQTFQNTSTTHPPTHPPISSAWIFSRSPMKSLPPFSGLGRALPSPPGFFSRQTLNRSEPVNSKGWVSGDEWPQLHLQHLCRLGLKGNRPPTGIRGKRERLPHHRRGHWLGMYHGRKVLANKRTSRLQLGSGQRFRNPQFCSCCQAISGTIKIMPARCQNFTAWLCSTRRISCLGKAT